MKEALLRVDVQNDFCPGGKLGVDDGDTVVRPLNFASRVAEQMGMLTIDSVDWHELNNTVHFSEWPIHCIQGTSGAELRGDLYIPTRRTLIRKGMGQTHGYSPFEGFTPEGLRLIQLLEQEGAEELKIGGLTTEYCVKNAALDARKAGLRVVLLEDAVRPVSPGSNAESLAKEEMQDAGVIFLPTRMAVRRWWQEAA